VTIYITIQIRDTLLPLVRSKQQKLTGTADKTNFPSKKCTAAAVGTTGIGALSAVIYCTFRQKLILVMSLLVAAFAVTKKYSIFTVHVGRS
jgi:hypothetical protein